MLNNATKNVKELITKLPKVKIVFSEPKKIKKKQKIQKKMLMRIIKD